LNYLNFAYAVIGLMNIPEPWSLSVERTNWKVGRFNINILLTRAGFCEHRILAKALLGATAMFTINRSG
jgi:hypothetical protein